MKVIRLIIFIIALNGIGGLVHCQENSISNVWQVTIFSYLPFKEDVPVTSDTLINNKPFTRFISNNKVLLGDKDQKTFDLSSDKKPNSKYYLMSENSFVEFSLLKTEIKNLPELASPVEEKKYKIVNEKKNLIDYILQ